MTTLPTLSDAEIVESAPAGDDAGFGSLSTPSGNLPLAAMTVRGKVTGLLAGVAVTQSFVNNHDVPLEATYIFPLPDRFATTRFRFEVAGRVIEGVLKERGAARREYDAAIRTGHRAAIAEEDRPDVFSLRVGNLMPGETATVRLDLAGPLTFADGEATFRFPLVVAPRYIPGSALDGASVGTGTVADTDAVPDASRITPPVLLRGFPNPVKLALSVDVDPAGMPLTDFRCSLHAIAETTDTHGIHRIALYPGERLDRDFVLRWKVGGTGISTSLVCVPDAKSPGEGTFSLTLVPPVGLASSQPPRDVALVLDRSGSMGGWKMVAARRAMARMIETLTPRDRFAVLAFDDSIEVPPGSSPRKLVPATDRNRFLADRFLGTVDARGGTEMAQPLELAADALAEVDASRERILVLVTDGQVGNEDQILKHLAPKMRGARIFALGIDQAVNAGFLNRLAALGRGQCELIESEVRLDEVADRVHRHLGTPVLTGVKLDAESLGIVAETVTPTRLPDLYAGSPLTISGRYRGSPESLSVHATTLSRDAKRSADTTPWHVTVPADLRTDSVVEHAWARTRVRALEDRYAIAADPHLAKQIVDTSIRFGVLCRFTAFVAVDRSEVVNPGGVRHEVTQAVEMPAGWEMQKEFTKHRMRSTHVSGAGGFAPTAARCAPMSPAPMGQFAPPPDASAEAAEEFATDYDPLEFAKLGSRPHRKAKSRGILKRARDAMVGSPSKDEAAERVGEQGGIRQLTKDHNIIRALIEAGTITEAEAKDHRCRNVMWKYLGSKEVGENPDVYVIPASPEDRFLLCSDGLSGPVRSEDLLAFVQLNPEVQPCADGLVQLALDTGSRDNVTVIVAKVEADGSLAVGSCIDVGRYRENNEDSLGVVRFNGWTVCIVADGMGGQAAGEVASKKAIEILTDALRRSLTAGMPDAAVQDAIRKAIVRANEEILAMKNMGSTVVLAAWRTGGKAMFVANLGDSRCYHLPAAGK